MCLSLLFFRQLGNYGCEVTLAPVPLLLETRVRMRCRDAERYTWKGCHRTLSLSSGLSRTCRTSQEASVRKEEHGDREAETCRVRQNSSGFDRQLIRSYTNLLPAHQNPCIWYHYHNLCSTWSQSLPSPFTPPPLF